MSNNNYYSNKAHIKLIAEKLKKGQASLIVGAGFSLNAKKINPNSPSIPSWSELANRLYEKLYPYDEGQDKNKYENDKIRATADALNLASEFEVAFGRNELNQFLMEQIPDNEYEPNKLYEDLMRLNWVDIFTTNYDTLLERQAKYIIERKYNCIQTLHDIPAKIKPRIIKLHGSFPSSFPFIITKEDYRTYPVLFAPFVNMVQQSVMENTMCLIGFSGDDPNFYNWTGWVRDNLGKSMPFIYLCGFPDRISTSKQQLLEQQKIKIVNFSHYLTPEELNSSQKYQLGIERFIEDLKKLSSPPNPKKWPEEKNLVNLRY